MEFLLIGPENSGKTYLMKCLQRKLSPEATKGPSIYYCQAENMTLNSMVAESFATLPYCVNEGTSATVGVDIVDFTLDNLPFKVTELGGIVFPRWSSYFSAANAFIFMIDIADMGNWPTAMVCLYETISYEALLKDKEMLLILNKTDLCDPLTERAGEGVMYLDELPELKKELTILSGSCFDSSFLDKILEWIRKQLDNRGKS
jgi:GTPase SAR1 family protein